MGWLTRCVKHTSKQRVGGSNSTLRNGFVATLGAMSNLLGVLIGALLAASGVIAGTWLQGRKEHQRWLRDQKLRAAIDFIGAAGDLHDGRRHPLRSQARSKRRTGHLGTDSRCKIRAVPALHYRHGGDGGSSDHRRPTHSAYDR